MCVFPLHNVSKAWEQNVSLLLKHTPLISTTLWASTFLCQFIKVSAKSCCWDGAGAAPGDGPALPEAELRQGTAVSAGSALGMHSPHRSHPCLPALGTAEALKTECGHSTSSLVCVPSGIKVYACLHQPLPSPNPCYSTAKSHQSHFQAGQGHQERPKCGDHELGFSCRVSRKECEPADTALWCDTGGQELQQQHQ